jgi:hypothetical protein
MIASQTFLEASQGQKFEPRCGHEHAATMDPVTGTAYCRQEREHRGKSGCGREGRLWKKK